MKTALFYLLIAVTVLSPSSRLFSEETERGTTGTLTVSTMCETIQDYVPVNRAVVFSIETGRVYCYTSFSDIREKDHIVHTWYRRDRQATQTKLTINPPRWSTYSSLQLRETDKGPWRVEISDSKGKILTVLRFSITD